MFLKRVREPVLVILCYTQISFHEVPTDVKKTCSLTVKPQGHENTPACDMMAIWESIGLNSYCPLNSRRATSLNAPTGE